MQDHLFSALQFAGNAEIVALWGGGFLVFALFAMAMERRRMRRSEINRVGFVPWTTLFVLSAILGGGLLVAAVPPILANLI